jgi:hypothetical protein
MTCDAYQHLTRIAVEVRDIELLPGIANELGWAYREQAVVANCYGPGLLPPGWRYPIVVQDAQLAFADFASAEGNQAGVEQLKASYTLACARKAANAQGYDVEQGDGELIIYQPGGVIVTVRGDGTLELNRLDLVDGDPTVYLQEALGEVVESAFDESHHHSHTTQVLHTSS